MIIALAGNPNVGKSTLFNALTGLKQHTGNWPGKTVDCAYGTCYYQENEFTFVDLPGTYSLLSNSFEEELARNFICFDKPDLCVVVCDATCIERNLNLVLQILEITGNVIVCVNLMDEAAKKSISINLKALSSELGVPVIGTSARSRRGLTQLMQKIAESERHGEIQGTAFHHICYTDYSPIFENCVSQLTEILEDYLTFNINHRWISVKLIENNNDFIKEFEEHYKIQFNDYPLIQDYLCEIKETLKSNNISSTDIQDFIVSSILSHCEHIYCKTVKTEKSDYDKTDRKLDKLLTGKKTGIPIMLLLLMIVFWLTITGANYPSEFLSKIFFGIETQLFKFSVYIKLPTWISEMLIHGIYRVLAWVVSVMLPPMAIFFPLFTLLEDSGYLPRVAFNLDHHFKKACACGKQCLTMCMGFGCNAAGIIGCRIIDSKRERLIAIITNCFVPCNGRFPTIIAMISMFFVCGLPTPFNSLLSAIFLTLVILAGIFMTFLVSKILSRTLLKGIPSSFTLELPPYRRPQIGKVILHSIFDRTLFVLGRAVLVAIPAGLIIWLLANIHIDGNSILNLCITFFNPLGHFMGLDGAILIGFILGFPANEIVIPIIIMAYMSNGYIIELDNLSVLKQLFIDNGWTPLTALCTILFALMHWPCSTTCITIKKETQSLKWTIVSFLTPTIAGILICAAVANLSRLFSIF